MTAAEIHNLIDADVVPLGVAAICVFRTDAILDRGVGAARAVLWLTAVAAAALAAVLGAVAAMLSVSAIAVAAVAAAAAIGVIPGARPVTIADAVVFPVARVVHHAADAAAAVARADVAPAAAAIAAAELFHLVDAHVVPLGVAAERVLSADAVLDALVAAARPVLGCATVASAAWPAVLGA